mmetsp:Transcript_14399/g.47748  ORF Transcript_14399/g.47748 Transcript_14399/m.47748 type:complete len:316 (-) Transcript_14399:53-1000(-)
MGAARSGVAAASARNADAAAAAEESEEEMSASRNPTPLTHASVARAKPLSGRHSASRKLWRVATNNAAVSSTAAAASNLSSQAHRVAVETSASARTDAVGAFCALETSVGASRKSHRSRRDAKAAAAIAQGATASIEITSLLLVGAFAKSTSRLAKVGTTFAARTASTTSSSSSVCRESVNLFSACAAASAVRTSAPGSSWTTRTASAAISTALGRVACVLTTPSRISSDVHATNAVDRLGDATMYAMASNVPTERNTAAISARTGPPREGAPLARTPSAARKERTSSARATVECSRSLQALSRHRAHLSETSLS